MKSYKILKVPLSKEKAVFYYYKRYRPQGNDESVSLPEERTIQICHFVRPIDENTVQKYFGLAGKIKQIQIGEYKNKANNKRKRRTVYFALVVYKSAEDCLSILTEPKVFQGKVNKMLKKSVKFSRNPFADEDEGSSSEEDPEKVQQKEH
jgi:hypothetical protein